jgi:hypothetical protein
LETCIAEALVVGHDEKDIGAGGLGIFSRKREACNGNKCENGGQ